MFGGSVLLKKGFTLVVIFETQAKIHSIYSLFVYSHVQLLLVWMGLNLKYLQSLTNEVFKWILLTLLMI